jgi:hypothetical protein
MRAIPATRPAAMLLALAGTLVLCLAQPAHSSAWPGKFFDASPAWCGSSGASDWVCRWRGHTYIDDELLPKRQARLLPAGPARVYTPLSSLARLTFRNQARCTIGGGNLPSEVITRWEDTLLKQISGDASCTNLKTGQPIETLCDDRREQCSGEVRARGTFISHVVPPPEATASLTEAFYRKVRIVVCAGSVRARVENDSSFSEGGGSATGGNRFVITMEETRNVTSDETVTEAGTAVVNSKSSSVKVNVIGTMPGPGPCASSFVEEQEHTIAE